MSGARRLVVAEITEGKLKGKALSDALARELNSDKMKDKKDCYSAKSKKK